MKPSRLITIALLTGALASPLRAAEFTPEPGFTPLFNGRDLTGWRHQDGPALDGQTDAGDGRYVVAGGALVANDVRPERKRVLLWTVNEYVGNFVLRFEFRAGERTDGGLFLIQTQLQCGDYSSYAYPEFAMYRPLEWNAIEVTVQDGVARCTCNGEVLEAALKITEPGAIAFEADRGAISYRRIRIKTLP